MDIADVEESYANPGKGKQADPRAAQRGGNQDFVSFHKCS